jgi:hypothetical protein
MSNSWWKGVSGGFADTLLFCANSLSSVLIQELYIDQSLKKRNQVCRPMTSKVQIEQMDCHSLITEYLRQHLQVVTRRSTTGRTGWKLRIQSDRGMG